MSKKAILHIDIDSLEEFTYRCDTRITQHFFGHHEFEIQVPIEALEGQGQYVFAKSKDLIGKTIKMSMESEQMLDAQSPTFTGIITELFCNRLFGVANHLVIKGQSPTLLLDNGFHSRSFTEKTLSDIVEEVVAEYPENLLGRIIKPEFTEVIPYLVQYQETDFHFLSSIANTFGEWFYFNGVDLIFGKQDLPEPLELELGKNLQQFHLGMSLIPVNFQLDNYDYLKNETMNSIAKDRQVDNLDEVYGKLVFKESEKIFSKASPSLSNIHFSTQQELDDFVQKKRDQQASSMVQLKGQGEHVAAWVGQTISITGYKAEDPAEGFENYGEFLITNITHRVHADGFYVNEFEAIPKEAGVPPLNHLIIPTQAESQPAIVKDNKDPEKLGRVRVQLYWQKAPEMTPWVRLVSSHGGSSGGFYILPEIGDEVMVSFEHDNPDDPFVLGSMFHGKAKPVNNWYSEENNIKAIRTKSGNEIIFNDEGGNETIKIVNINKNSITLTMSDGGSISISGCNSLNMSAKTIAINAEEDLTISAKNITVDAQENYKLNTGTNIELNAGGDAVVGATNCSVQASANIEIAAGMGLAASGQTSAEVTSGANLTLSAMANAEMSGTAGAKVSGAMVNVEGQTLTTVKGGLIQLN